ncbi:MAG: hypothetical protein J7J82_03715 [Staphylothermus sp.]|nr:hypothetical protein [Staphylothermus sp.]
MSSFKDYFPPRSLVVLVVFVSLIGFVVSTIYRGMFLAYISSFLMYEYSYMYVLVPLLFFVLLYMLLNYFEPAGLSIDRLFLSLGIYFSSLLFFLVYRFYSDTVIQYGVVSFIFLVWSFIVLVYKPLDIRYYLVLVFLMLLFIPPPLSWINYLSKNLSYVMGYLASVLVGAEAEHAGDSFYVWVMDSVGNKHLFEITFAYNGFIGLASVLSIVPLLVYVIMRTDEDLGIKIKAFLLSILVSSGTILLGNLLYLVTIFLITRFYSYDLALVIFHQTPIIIYVICIVLAIVSGFCVLRKTMEEKTWSSRETHVSLNQKDLINNALATSFIVLLLMSIGYGVLVNSLTASHVGESIVLPSVEALAENPLLTIFNNTGISVLKNEPAQHLTIVLGSPIVREITIAYNNSIYTGYLEVAETPSRMHSWYTYLTSQGYRVVKSWTIRNNIVINYMLISKDNKLSLLSYITFKLLVLFGNTTQLVYVRLSLFKPTTMDGYGDDVFTLEELFQKVSRNTDNFYSSRLTDIFEKIVYLVNGFILLNLVLVVLSLGRNKLYGLVKSLARKR